MFQRAILLAALFCARGLRPLASSGERAKKSPGPVLARARSPLFSAAALLARARSFGSYLSGLLARARSFRCFALLVSARFVWSLARARSFRFACSGCSLALARFVFAARCRSLALARYGLAVAFCSLALARFLCSVTPLAFARARFFGEQICSRATLLASGNWAREQNRSLEQPWGGGTTKPYSPGCFLHFPFFVLGFRF